MDRIKNSFFFLAALLLVWGCEPKPEETPNTTPEVEMPHSGAKYTGAVGEEGPDWQWLTDQFADLRILRYEVPGFAELPLAQKELLYYLYEAAMCGREIIYDQNYKHNLFIKRSLENILETYSGDKSGDDWTAFHNYLKRIWFSNGIHHHYSTKKMAPEFDAAYFETLVKGSDAAGFPLAEGQSIDDMISMLTPILFDPNVDFKRVNLNEDADLAAGSANNYYEGVTQAEVEAYYDSRKDSTDSTPISWGLNSKMVKENGTVVEKVYKVGGMYSNALTEVADWMEKAAGAAENDKQGAALTKLAEYFRTGDLKTFDDYSIAWVEDVDSDIDVINGFIEVYGDAMGYRGAYESVVQLTDPEASRRIEAISKEAQWFEDNSSIMDEHKKEEVKGISARVINVVVESGDASPSTPIGINLPNANWIRSEHGSKSVNLANIVNAYDEASKSSGVLEEFAYNEEEIRLAKEYGALSDNLHTDMHEVIGHASGKINPGIGTPKETLKSYSSTLEEGRADLVALYYMIDPKLVEIGVMPNLEVGKSQYNDYIRNGMMLQLRRLDIGENIEEAHMRNRQLICHWVYEKGAADKVVEKVTKDGKSYFVINDYNKLRTLFGDLLREIQRIKSEGDYAAGKALVEDYGVKVDQEIHAEVLARVEKLGIAPYSGFINPILEPVMEGGKITDVVVKYPTDFTEQHLYYSKSYGLLPTYN